MILRIVHAKSYETVSTFVKVMQRKPLPLVFPVYNPINQLYCIR